MTDASCAQLDSLASLVNEKVTAAKDPSKPYVGLEHLPSGGSSLLGTAESGQSTSTNNVFRRGDVLFGKLRPRLRKSIRVPFDGYCSTDILVLRPAADVDPSFAGFVLQSDAVFVEGIRTEEGTKMPRCSWSTLRKLRVFCPGPTQQKRIAEILSTVDEAIERTEALIAKTQQTKAGLMHDLFTRGITPDGQLRPPREEAPHLYKKSPLGWIPKEWTPHYMRDLYKEPIRDFGSFSSTNLITFLDEGIPFIKSEMIEAGKINWASVTYISPAIHVLLSKSHVRNGDILFSKIGSALGKAVVYNGDHGECNSNAAIAKISVDPKKACKHFVAYFLNHPATKQQFGKVIISLLPRINLGDISNLRLATPLIQEQEQIENRLLEIDSRLSAEEETLSKYLRIKTGLMHDLLTGRVQVGMVGSQESLT